MAVKTITIDMEAYGLLSRAKGEGKSFSDVIKEHFGRAQTAARFRDAVKRIRLSDDTLDAIDAVVKARKASPARVVRL